MLTYLPDAEIAIKDEMEGESVAKREWRDPVLQREHGNRIRDLTIMASKQVTLFFLIGSQFIRLAVSHVTSLSGKSLRPTAGQMSAQGR